ncbi:MAG: heme-binding protein, partial [Planctomycetota bacterium]|nr:heme-binding protein [Planctomycetota bacterium]
MKKLSIACLFAATFLFAGLTLLDSHLDDGKALAAAKAVPQWIWLGNPSDSNETIYFRHTFELSSVPKSVTVAGSCDNSMRVYINGKKAVSSNEWSTPVRAEIAKSLVKGKNVIAVEAVNSGGPGGLILSVDSWKSRPRGDKKGSPILSTGPAWKASRKSAGGWKVAGFNDSEWKKSTSLAEIGGGPWGSSVNSSTLVNAGAPPKPVQATATDSLIVAPGFKVELLYSVPKGSEGSWVTLTVDPEGRLIASDQYGALYRITPSPIGKKGETLVERLAGNAGHAHGLLYAFDSLYVVQSEKDRGLYRMRDTNGDGQFDDRKLLRSIQGGGEHGPHAVILGPEKKYIYVIGGNHTNLPNPEKSLVPRTWKEDLLLPRLWDARGHARGKLAPGGWIARTDPEGKTWELVSNGYRNQYDIAFNKNGELFTYDADMEWDVGTPWYRPTRVNHVISGGEFGWRSGTGKWPTYYPDSLGRVVDVGPGSPTGIGFGYGADFPVKYQEALYICDWSYGKLYAVHMTPDGGTYTGELEQFIAGAPFPLTDVIVNPKDKALYVSVGGRRTQSGLYRVTYTGNDKGGVAKTSPESTKLRAQRKELEKYHGKQDPAALEAAWPHLSSPDRYLRYAARIAVEHQPVDSWKDKVIGELNDIALIQGAIALARHGKAEIRPKLLAALRNIKASSLDETQLINLLRAYSLVFIRLGKPAEATGA